MSNALAYHAKFPQGKLAISITKKMETAADLSLAYSPGVADPCNEIERDPSLSYTYTNKGNLVAVISNGTAVLGLGDIGALASKPVMEGKAALFKIFAGIDSYDIELDENDPQKIIDIVRAIAPTFGGINLEDIKAPECFDIEKTLIDMLDIPVFHDDQHGTAIIASAALKNACEIQKKNISELKTVVSGAGAGAISTMNMLVACGLDINNIYVFDSKGLITKSRTDLNKYKLPFARDTHDMSIAEALVGADLFVGLSKGGLLDGPMIARMNDSPIIFALANPTPEILPDVVHKVRSDAIVATGRSDYPNQANNVICFPHLFRGALDVGAKKITLEMKMACIDAIANLAKQPVLQDVLNIYGLDRLEFGPDYIIPKPFDKRLCYSVAKAVAEKAIEQGISTRSLPEGYADYLQTRFAA